MSYDGTTKSWRSEMLSRLWKDPAWRERNIAGRKSDEFQRTHQFTPQARAKAREVAGKSPKARLAIEKMREVLLKSPVSQPGVTHNAARRWHLRSPSNIEYHFTNLLHFIREHRSLFNPEDLTPKDRYGACRVSTGLGMLRPSDKKKRTPGSWKGWTWISMIEVFNNGQEDLLERKLL